MNDRSSSPTFSHGSHLTVLRTCITAMMAMLAVSCAGLPQLQPIEASADKSRQAACSAVFPSESWRLVHSIETVIAGHPAGVVMGITIVDPIASEIQAVIMTLEGLILFHARHSSDTTDILRAVAPFDSPKFAKGLIDDVRLLFLAPVGVTALSGISSSGAFTCRYIRSDTSTVDIVPGPDGGWLLREYDGRGKLRRKVTAHSPQDCSTTLDGRLPCHIDLEAFHRPAYVLKMSLIEAERLTEENR